MLPVFHVKVNQVGIIEKRNGHPVYRYFSAQWSGKNGSSPVRKESLNSVASYNKKEAAGDQGQAE